MYNLKKQSSILCFFVVAFFSFIFFVLCFAFTNSRFDIAASFYNNCIKLPVWGYEEDLDMVERYIKGIEKVCWYIENTELFNF